MFRWFPWQYVVRRAAKSYGILDPISVLARIRQFAEPSESPEPLEIVRAWVIFHSRGLVNTRAIQHNLDWIWPYWVERQFNPRDPSFIPRAYSISHINMTHRDWTAVGLPGVPIFPIVDPRGMVTPLHDGWSLDFWVLGAQPGQRLVPSKMDQAEQEYLCGEEHTVRTRIAHEGRKLESRVYMDWQKDVPTLCIDVSAQAEAGSYLVVTLRPYNPEGVQFIDAVESLPNGGGWKVNGQTEVLFRQTPEKLFASNYEHGDVSNLIRFGEQKTSEKCAAGMATAAALFPIRPEGSPATEIRIPLTEELTAARKRGAYHSQPVQKTWKQVDAQTCRMRVPDERMQRLFTAAARTLLLLSPEEVYPGPYVYRRFWYRDAAFMMNGLLAINHPEPCRRIIEDVFPRRHRASGFFESQEGEWDSNGEVLWIAARYCAHTGEALSPAMMERLKRGARWIRDKRLPMKPGETCAGLLPAGFSAEHLGPNNYYYWDNFWGIAGLQAIVELLRTTGENELANEFSALAESYEKRVWETIEQIPERRAEGAIPAAPNRRLDAGAIGSVVADFPLQLTPPGQTRIMRTVQFLADRCLVRGGFFQDMTHSGINPYLTLHLAQIYLRAGDARYRALIDAVAALASPTGLWPEAVHPSARGGCMGDGQHGWAAAEWALAMRSLFLREERGVLILCSGLYPEWLESDQELSFGPTLTPWGRLTVTITGPRDARDLWIKGEWRSKPRQILVSPPGWQHGEMLDPAFPFRLSR